MLYVKGFKVTEVGSLLAKVHFEGFVAAVHMRGDHYVIQGVTIPTEQVLQIAATSVSKESLDLQEFFGLVQRRKPRKVKAKEPNPFEVEFNGLMLKWGNELEDAIKECKRYNRMLPYGILEAFEEKRVDLVDSFKFGFYAEDENLMRSAISRVVTLYVEVIFEVDSAVTAKQYVKKLQLQTA